MGPWESQQLFGGGGKVSKTGASRVVLRTRAVPMVVGSWFES